MNKYDEETKEKSDVTASQMEGGFKPVIVDQTMRKSVTSNGSSGSKRRSFI